MSNTAQAYLESLAAEHQAAIDAYRAEQELKEQKRINELRRDYSVILDKMPSELAEYYSFDPSDPACPLKLSIPRYMDIHVGLWGGTPRYKCGSNRASDIPLSAAIDFARYGQKLESEPELEPEPEPEAPAPKPVELTRVEQAQVAIDKFDYHRAIALALVEVAVQLSEIDRSVVALNSNNY